MSTRTYLHAKIHRATVTDANLEYEGSISICPKLLKTSGIRLFEKVEIYNLANGERFATYVIEGQEREICINGAAARKAHPGDLVIIAAYTQLSDEEYQNFQPRIVLTDKENRASSSPCL